MMIKSNIHIRKFVFAVAALLPVALLLVIAITGDGEARTIKERLLPAGCQLPAADRCFPDSAGCRLLYSLFESTGASFKAVNISGWGEVDGPALKETVAEAAGRMGVAQPAESVEAWTNPCAEGFRLRAETSGGDEVSVLGQTVAAAERSDLMVSFTTRGESRLQTAAGELYPLFRDGRVAVTVCGVLERPLSSAEMLAEAERLLAEAGAAEVEKTAADHLVSVTGHTGQLPGGLHYAGRKVNLNIALRCNPAEQKTYVYIAAPLIFIEY